MNPAVRRTVDKLLRHLVFMSDESIAALATCVAEAPVAAGDIARRRERRQAWAAQLRRLLEAPGIPQRTDAWYAARKGMITASDFGALMGVSSYRTRRDVVAGKLAPPTPDGQSNRATYSAPLVWGVKYEPVANMLYRWYNGVELHEFGLLRDPETACMGASPDGVTGDGVMVEFKCPFRRKMVHGEVPSEYLMQIQGQLAVCGLDECDFVECEFAEVASGADLFADRPAAPHGVIMETPAGYTYSPVAVGADPGLRGWYDREIERLAADDTVQHVREYFWVLQDYNCVRVVRDDACIAELRAAVLACWAEVEEGLRNPAPPSEPKAVKTRARTPTKYDFLD